MVAPPTVPAATSRWPTSTVFATSRRFRVLLGFPEDPTSEFVLRGYEHAELRRAPLEELTAKLFEPLLDGLLVPHRRGGW